MNKVKKFVPVMLTPFDEKGAIDYAVLTKLTEYYIEAGAKGLFANCLSSEMFELTNDERVSITRHIVDVAAGAVPVVSTGTFEGSSSFQADFVKRIYDAGANAVIVISSILAREDEPGDILNERVFNLFDQTENIPLGFYECPVPYKRTLSPSQLRSFVQTGRLLYYKDTSLSVDAIREKIKATREFEFFELYDAHMANALPSLKAGCAGLSCIQGNFSPELVTWLAENYNDQTQAEQVKRVQQFFIDKMDVMHQVYPVVAKYFLQQKGLPISLYTRRDIGVLTNDIRKQIEQLVVDCDEVLSDLGINTKIVA